MEKTVAGTIKIRNRIAFFIRDVDEALPLTLSCHDWLKYHLMDEDRLTSRHIVGGKDTDETLYRDHRPA